MTNTLQYGDELLWCATGTAEDTRACGAALAAGRVSGVYVTPGDGWAAPDLDFLAQLDGLRVLNIGMVRQADISVVSRLHQLEHLRIQDGAGAVELDGLHQLRELWLDLKPGPGRQFRLPAAGLPRLERLLLWHLPDTDLDFLRHYPRLRQLHLTQAGRLASLAGLAHCGALETLGIAYCPKLRDIGALGQARTLLRLALEQSKGLDGYASLQALQQLRELKIIGAAPLPDLAFVRHMPALESVVIRKTAILDHDLSPLLDAPLLAHAYLDKKKEYGSLYGEIERMVQARHDAAAAH